MLNPLQYTHTEPVSSSCKLQVLQSYSGADLTTLLIGICMDSKRFKHCIAEQV